MKKNQKYVEREFVMMNKADEFCIECHKHARTLGKEPCDDHDGDTAYWIAYNQKWDELCPDFNPITGRGFD